MAEPELANAEQVQPVIDDLILLIDSENADELALKSEVDTHFQRYKQRIIENADSNFVSRTLEVGDQVLIKKDFDMNPTTRRQPFESFYEDSPYTVVSFHNNNMIELKDNNGNTKTVFRGVIKKI